jgi:hypothetical protein
MSVRAVTVFFPGQFVSSTHAGCVYEGGPPNVFFLSLKPVAVSAAAQFTSRYLRRAMFSQLARQWRLTANGERQISISR